MYNNIISISYSIYSTKQHHTNIDDAKCITDQ